MTTLTATLGRTSYRALSRDAISMIAWRMTQRVLAALGLVVLSPLFAVLYVAVKTTSRGDFFFRQERVGFGGVTFRIFKIRTMAVGAEARTRLGVQANHASVTAVGRLLRVLKLDELPQLINIARGEMEIVGPRPIPLALHEKLANEIAGFDLRNKVRPGLTHRAQLCDSDLERTTSVTEDWASRFEQERDAITTRTVASDLCDIVATARFVVDRFWGVATNSLQRDAVPVAPATLRVVRDEAPASRAA